MGDQVQKLLEEMVPELEDLQTRGLFTPAEVKAIVRKRTDFEYRFHRRVPLLSDFLRYIQYEMNLDLLRKKRKFRLGLMKNSVSDFAPVKRIHFIYERSLRKFNDDIGLWLQFIDFASKSGSDKILAGLFPRALRLHGQVPLLWMRAAQWEHRHNQDMDAARHMLQRGIRINPASPGLYLYFFKLEVAYTQKIRDRRSILGLNGSTTSNDTESKDPVSLIEAAAAGVSSEDDSKTPKTNAEKTSTINASERAILSGVLPMTIFRNALRVPSLAADLSLRLQFLSAVPHSANPRYSRRKLEKSLRKQAVATATPSTVKTEANGTTSATETKDALANGATTEGKKRRRGDDADSDGDNDDERKTDTPTDGNISDDDDNDDTTDAATAADTAPLNTSGLSQESLASQSAIDNDLQPLCQQIIDSLSNDFATSPEVWRVRALWQLRLAQKARTASTDTSTTVVDVEKAALVEWEAGVNVPGAESDMWMAYAQYLHDRLHYYSNVVTSSSTSSTSVPSKQSKQKNGGKRAKGEPIATDVTSTNAITGDQRKEVSEWLVARILEVCEMAMGLTKLSPQLLIMWARLLLQCGKESDADVVARLGVSPSWFASSTSVWLLLIHMQTKRFALGSITTSDKDTKESKDTDSSSSSITNSTSVSYGSLIALYDQALASVSPSTSYQLWRGLLDLHIARVAAFPWPVPASAPSSLTKQRRAAHRACSAAFRAAIAASSPAASAASATSAIASTSSSTSSTNGDDSDPNAAYCLEGQQFKQQYIEWLILDSSSNTDDIRSACDFVLAARPPSLSLYLTCVRATTASFASDKDASTRLRAVYEAAITDFGTDAPELWLEFISWEMSHKNFQRANQIHWRAIKTLAAKHQSTFVESHNRIK